MRPPSVLVALLCIASRTVFANPSLHPREVESESELVGAIMEASSGSHCTVVLLSDSTSQSILQGPGWGGSVVVLQASNTTLLRLAASIAKVRVMSWCVTVVVASSDLAFLDDFASQVRRVRMLVWATRLVMMTRLPVAKVGSLLTRHWTFSMMNTLVANLDPIHGQSPNRWEVFVHLPYSVAGPLVMRVATWTPDRGLTILSKTQLFPRKYSNFHGATVPVTALILPPFWKVVDNTARDSWTKFSGRDCLLMKSVARALNFTFRMHRSSNIDEIMSSLEANRVYLSGFRIMLIPQILARVDHTYFIDRATFTFSMARPSTKPQWQSLYYPLAREVWLVTLAFTVLMPFVFYALVYLEGDSRTRIILTMRSPTLETVGMLLGQDLLFRLPRGDAARILVFVWLVFAFLMGTSYRGTLTAFLSVPKYPSRPENMEELAQVGVRSKFTQNATRFLIYFQQSNLDSYRSVSSRVDIVTTVLDGLGEISENNVAFFHERYNSELMIAEHFSRRDGTSELYVAKENVIPNYAAWMMPHDAPYKSDIDRSLINIMESGLKEKFTEDMMGEAWQEIRQKQNLQQQQQKGHNDTTTESSRDAADSSGPLKPLNMTQLQGALWLVVLGLILATMAFLCEYLAAWRISDRLPSD